MLPPRLALLAPVLIAAALTFAPVPALAAEPLVCPVDTVPGWLDENNKPTSCVNNHAFTPGHEPATTPAETIEPAPAVYVPTIAPGLVTGPAAPLPVDVPAPPAMLAETGRDISTLWPLALVLLVPGALLAFWAFRRGDDSLMRNLARSKAAGHDANDVDCYYYAGDFAGIDLLALCPACTPARPISHRRR